MSSRKESIKKKTQRSFSIESILSLPSPKIKQKPNSVQQGSSWVPSGQCQVSTCQNNSAVPGCNCCCCAHSNHHCGQEPSWLNSQLHWPVQIVHTVPEDGGKRIQSGVQSINSMPVIQRRTRRHRTIFTEEQLQALEETFHQNQYPDVIAREQLAGRIHLREERVEVIDLSEEVGLQALFEGIDGRCGLKIEEQSGEGKRELLHPSSSSKEARAEMTLDSS
ncbi:unnamed protein product [Ranitomeya imitator]|uniref:Homeobox domain-containing protein n=1 Tax=Ranitomeya imitator TaxID=111125 RepID=A0ABN9KXC4_9NEOB|nr:unnamed protein product [Ranitomeya imitator]